MTRWARRPSALTSAARPTTRVASLRARRPSRVREVVELEGARPFFPEERPGELVQHLRRFWEDVNAR